MEGRPVPIRYAGQSQHSPGAADSQIVMVSARKLENMNCIVEPSVELGGIYLGDVVSTLKEDLLRAHGIQAVLTCMYENSPSRLQCPHHKVLQIRDILEYPIIRHFDEAIEWITAMRQQKLNILVHCHAGVSRSATIVCAYFIKTHGWSPAQALDFVRSKRERAKPNASFWQQLNEYHAFLNSVATHQSKLVSPPQQAANGDRALVELHTAKGNQNQESSPELPQNKVDSHPVKEVKKKKGKFSLAKRRKIFEKNQLLEGVKLPEPPQESPQQTFTPVYNRVEPNEKYSLGKFHTLPATQSAVIEPTKHQKFNSNVHFVPAFSHAKSP